MLMLAVSVDRGTAHQNSERSLAPVNLSANMGDGLLIHRSSIPSLKCNEIGLPGLIARAGAPAMRLEEICRRGQRISGNVEISSAVIQNALWHELGLTDFTMHRAARAGGEDSALRQFQRGVELVGEKFRSPTVVGERRDGG